MDDAGPDLAEANRSPSPRFSIIACIWLLNQSRSATIIEISIFL
jgi:hypothetical protein